MALLPTTLVSRAGVVQAAGATPTATTGDTFQPGEKVMLVVKTSGTATNVTVKSQTVGPEGQNLDSPNAVAVGATATVRFGPFPSSRYGDGSGLATVICSAITGVTLEVVALP